MTFLSLYDRESSRAIDEAIMVGLKLSPIELIRKAGERILALLLEKWPQTKSIAVVCGVGKNGADGFVLALLAKRLGLNIHVYSVGDKAFFKSDTLVCYEECLRHGLSINKIAKYDGQCDIIVDAIFGVGLNRDVEGEFDEAVKIINRSGKIVLSIDIPSGVNCTTGGIERVAVKADMTVCFFGCKQGVFTGSGKTFAGEILVESLGMSESFKNDLVPTAYAVGFKDIKHMLAPRDVSSHKGDFGHLLLVGGAPGYSGAILLSGSAAIRSGAGLVSVGTHPNHAGFLTLSRPELMCHGISRLTDLEPLIRRATAVAVGPGLSRKTWGLQILKYLNRVDVPSVYDADALNLLALKPNVKQNRVLTPHSKEASRLLGCEVSVIESDRFNSAREIAERFGGTVLLKGPGSIIAHQNEPPVVLLDGNPGMASGGMGDVLTGVLGSFLAQGFAPKDATVLAGAVHSHAADIASENLGQRGLAASDLMTYIQLSVNP